MTKNNVSKQKPSKQELTELLATLQTRFEKHMNRHANLNWTKIQAKLEANLESDAAKLRSLHEMEASGGEPDVVSYDAKSDQYIFYDCSAESPAGRRSLCYDRSAFESRKANKPSSSALETAAAMGIEILSEEQYRELQKLGEFDTKTSSWVETPVNIRNLGGAIFCDRRYDTVFTYHNGAESYYGSRGFRGSLGV